MRKPRRRWRAVLCVCSCVVRLLSLCAWRRMLVRAHGGADRRPEIQPDQATQAPSGTQRKEEAVELARTTQRQSIPVEVAPGVATPAPPAGHPARRAPAARRDEEVREVLLRRALAADAPAWAPPPLFALSYYTRRAVERTGPIQPVEGLMCIQMTLPTVYVRALVN